MFRIHSLLAVFVLVTTCSLAQQVEKCSILVVTKVRSNVNNLTREDLKNFLLTFDQSCITDTHYTVNSNALLFTILNQHTDLLLSELEANNETIDLNAILYQFSEPSEPSFNINELIAKVNNTQRYGTMNRLVVEWLTKGLN
jgi:hypothetical protein